MNAEDDLAVCREAIKHGSRSFYAASKLLPRQPRDHALALYAFCRVADDEVDLKAAKRAAVASLRARLAQCYAGNPRSDPIDRAFARMIREVDMPRALPEALVDGLAWDAEERRYQTLSELRDYSARVASAVGAMMCVLMGAREANTLARACDLGVAMQLTNIARDVGEDAREGRLFLPLDWLEEAGIAPDALLANPEPSPVLSQLTRRLLGEARRLYRRSEAGIATLPRGCRPGIYAARYIYAGIGRRIALAGYDSVSARARTSSAEKLGYLMVSLSSAMADTVMPRSPVLHAKPLSETAFLVEAAAAPPRGSAQLGARSADVLCDVMGALKARDRALRSGAGFRSVGG